MRPGVYFSLILIRGTYSLNINFTIMHTGIDCTAKALQAKPSFLKYSLAFNVI